MLVSSSSDSGISSRSSVRRSVAIVSSLRGARFAEEYEAQIQVAKYDRCLRGRSKHHGSTSADMLYYDASDRASHAWYGVQCLLVPDIFMRSLISVC